MSATNASETAPVAAWPTLPELGGRDGMPSRDGLPPLHATSAWPVQRDRWERLVTVAQLPFSPAEVWAALVDPDAVKLWLAQCRGSLEAVGREVVLDFEDGEFFLCRPQRAGEAEDDPRVYELRYVWRWLGIGQAATVTWRIAPTDGGSAVTVTEEAFNPPADWQTWNGGGWPGILNQLTAYLRTGTSWRWPWRRMGPYVQIELPLSPFEAWNALVAPGAIQYWLQRRYGELEAGKTLSLVMGDASGSIEMSVRDIAEPGQMFPSFLPHVAFALRRDVWGCEVPGYLWIEPAGLDRSLLQVFHENWENLPPALQLSERKIVTDFWTGALVRATAMFAPRPSGGSGHSWS
jgi:uncharacterized protein YndB with AHSA1/START domain